MQWFIKKVTIHKMNEKTVRVSFLHEKEVETHGLSIERMHTNFIYILRIFWLS
jgi:hypothetical protein